MKTIGIIGGLGPMATVYYLELITRMADADRDQAHPRVLLFSLPDIPDRTAYILGNSADNPLPVMTEAALKLQDDGVQLLSIPCITAHFFYDALVKELDIPVLHLPRLVAQDVAAKGIRKVGLLATSGTIQSQVLEKEFAAAGVEVVVPDEKRQKLVMQIIYDQVKKGDPVNWESFRTAAAFLRDQGAEKLILGCTELPLLKKNLISAGNALDTEIIHILTRDCVDVLEVLAQHAVCEAGVPLRKEYRNVIR